MEEILSKLPFNSYGDIFNSVRNGKAKIKLLRSDCTQIAGLKHPYFSTLGIYIGFIIISIILILLSININDYWLLLYIPLNFILSLFVSYIPKVKSICWGILIVDLFLIKVSNFVLIFCLNYIAISFFYDIWWNIVYRQAIKELQYNEEIFLWSWNRYGLAIEDCYGNTYSKLNISENEKVVPNNFMIDNNKCIELSNIIMKGLNETSIDNALLTTYQFYEEQGIDLSTINIKDNNKYRTLSLITMIGLGTTNIDEAIKQTTTFYKEQGINVE